jgi:hypothetical protein
MQAYTAMSGVITVSCPTARPNCATHVMANLAHETSAGSPSVTHHTVQRMQRLTCNTDMVAMCTTPASSSWHSGQTSIQQYNKGTQKLHCTMQHTHSSAVEENTCQSRPSPTTQQSTTFVLPQKPGPLLPEDLPCPPSPHPSLHIPLSAAKCKQVSAVQ